MNPLYNQLNGGNVNPLFSRIKQFKDTFSGNPQQMIQSMLNSGKISQAQLNEYARQANEIYKLMK